MNKEFVKYEQALALKELGFDEPCFAYYGLNNVEDKLFFDIDPDDGELTSLNQNQFYHNNLSEVGRISAPLKQQVFRWFREEYKLEPEIISDMMGYVASIVDRNVPLKIRLKPSNLFQTYEEAELECLKKLIEKANEKTNT